MKNKLILFIIIAALVITVLPLLAWAETKADREKNPPLDVSLMGFKDQGVWYFLCEAPAYPVRIGPHYLTYGPPPPCCPPPGNRPGYPCKVK